MLYWLRFGALISLLAWQVAFAQPNGDNLKVGFVNIRKLMAEAPQLGQIQNNLSTAFEKQNQAIISLRNQLAQLSATYDKTEDKKTLLQLQKNIAEKQLLIAKHQRELQDQFNLRRNEALGKLQSLIVKMVAKVSKEKALDIVFNNTGVIYIDSRIDITPEVFKYLSEERID